MTQGMRSFRTNQVLGLMPDRDLRDLVPHLEWVDLPKGLVMTRPGHEITHVYFPTSGIASAIAVSPSGKRAEAGLFGREGFFPIVVAVGVTQAQGEIVMQIDGDGFRVPLETFLPLLSRSPALQQRLLRAIMAFTLQISATALSNAVHSVEERLARWLLMCHDRVDGNEIALTHDFIALMLSVRRPSVTSALHSLEGHGFIRSERGRITLRNRVAMEAFARDSYGAAEKNSRELMTSEPETVSELSLA